MDYGYLFLTFSSILFSCEAIFKPPNFHVINCHIKKAILHFFCTITKFSSINNPPGAKLMLVIFSIRTP